tara:strand:- start:20631 stop:21083 length:453 start_codon:yes stop_codon:yes gene_type:complete
MSDNLARLKEELAQAVTQRDDHLKSMADDFCQQDMDRLSALQKMVSDSKAAIEAAEAAKLNVQVATPVDSDTNAVVSLIRSGKSDRCVQVPADTSLADLMVTLDWAVDGFTFKKRVGPGQTVEITNINEKLGSGEHEIFISGKVAGGNAC